MGFDEDREANLPLQNCNDCKRTESFSKKPHKLSKSLRSKQDQPVNFQAARRRGQRDRKCNISLILLALTSLCLLLILLFGVSSWILSQERLRALQEILLRLETTTEEPALSVEDGNGTSDESHHPAALAVIKKVKLSSKATGFLAVPVNVTGNGTLLTPPGIPSHSEGPKKAPLTLLVELVQKGARFTCDTICEEPRVVKTLLRVNGESLSWEGLGTNVDDAKQEASFRALKELYAPHIVAEVFYEPRNFTFECTTLNDTLTSTSTSTLKTSKKC